MRKSRVFVFFAFSLLNIFGYAQDKLKNMEIKLDNSLNVLINYNQEEEEKKKVTLGHDFELLNIDLIFKNIDLKTGLNIKSKRDNILKVDTKDDELRSHDLGAKIYLDYTTPDLNGFKIINNFEYYLGDNSKNAEFVDKHGKTNVLGNTLIKSNLKGSVNKTDLDLLVEYKANQFVKFTKDESYLKAKLDVKNKFVKFKYSGEYDLNFSNKKFDPFKTKLEEFPDTLGAHYVHKVDNIFELKVNDENENINLDAKVEVNSLLQAKTNEKFELEAIYDYINPKLDIYYKKKFSNGLELVPKFKNDIMFKYTKTFAQSKNLKNKRSVLSYYTPGLELGLNYSKEFSKEMKLSNNLTLGYDLTTNIYPYISKSENILHKMYLNNKTEFKYLNDKFDINLKSDINTNLKIAQGKLRPSSDNIVIDFKGKYKVNDKLNLGYELKNKFEATSKEKTLNPSVFKENFDTSLNVNVTFFEKKDKEKLSLNNKVYGSIKAEFDNNPKDGLNKKENKKLIYFGDIVATSLIYELGLKNDLSYFKNINSKIDLNTGIKLESKFISLSLTSERIKTFFTNEEKEKNKGKELPKHSDYRGRKYNLGGQVKVTPYVNVKYNVVDKLFLNFGVDLGINTEKKVINLIKDKERPDNGTYSYMDKNFGFKDASLKLNAGLKYIW